MKERYSSAQRVLLIASLTFSAMNAASARAAATIWRRNLDIKAWHSAASCVREAHERTV